jgi:hypothetical protein
MEVYLVRRCVRMEIASACEGYSSTLAICHPIRRVLADPSWPPGRGLDLVDRFHRALFIIVREDARVGGSSNPPGCVVVWPARLC